jgi:hypothetical protein
MTEWNENGWMVPSSRNADMDVLFHSARFGARCSPCGLLSRILHNWEIDAERETIAITNAARAIDPNQKPSPNLSPDKNMMSSPVDFMG